MSTSSPSHRLPLLAAALAVLSLAGCAAVELNRRHPGAIANGNFAPARAAATHFGAAAAPCPVGGAYGVTVEKVAKLASDRGSTPAVMDGQLCAIAEAMLGWTEEGNPRDGVRTFMARYFGSISVGPQIIVNILETEDSRVIADAVAPTISQFANQAPNAHWGLATERLGTKKTKVVTVLDDVRVALDPLPRRLELGQRATLSGTLKGDLENPKVVISDARGKVTEGAVQPGKAFKAELACDDQSGTIVVEIRGEDMGNEVALSEFKVACGGPTLAGTVPVKAPAWPEETAQQEARIVEMIDAERAAAGVGRLAWSAPVGKIARAVAESLRDNAAKKGGAPVQVNVVQKLGEADIQAPIVLQNPAAGPTAYISMERLLSSPSHRANILNADVTTGGVGIASGVDSAGRTMSYLVQLLIKVQPPPDVPAAMAFIRQAIDKKRAGEKLGSLATDPTLEKLASEYAGAVAAAGGPAPKAKTDELVRKLKQGYKDIVFLVDSRIDLADFAEDPNALAKGRLVGLGGALGRHPRLGKNTLFVVLIIGNRK